MGGARRHGNHAERGLAPADAGGAARVAGDHEGKQRASRSGQTSDGGAGRGWGRDVLGGGASDRLSESTSRHLPGAAVQSGRAGVAGDRGRSWSAADLRRAGPRADRSNRAAATGSEGGWDGDLVAEHLGADDPPRGAAAGGATTIRRVLRDAGSSYQRTRTWCPTGTAQRKRKAGVVRVVDPRTEGKRGPSTWRTA